MRHAINTITPSLNTSSMADADVILSQVARLSYRELNALQVGISRRLGEYHTAMRKKSDSIDEADLLCLTQRETEVLTLVANGYTRREVGKALSITQNTAATHISTIYRKLDISSIAEATVLAIRSGLVS